MKPLLFWYENWTSHKNTHKNKIKQNKKAHTNPQENIPDELDIIKVLQKTLANKIQ